jgi:hypothetical protein
MRRAGIKNHDRVMPILLFAGVEDARADSTPTSTNVAVKLKLCLPMAAGPPIGGSVDLGTSPLFGQLTDKLLLVLHRDRWELGREAP